MGGGNTDVALGKYQQKRVKKTANIIQMTTSSTVCDYDISHSFNSRKLIEICNKKKL